jgi:type IV pilus assembly protein PilV
LPESLAMVELGRLPLRGFTLIEVLAALCLLSLAALAIVGLQWRSLHATHQSALQRKAMQLAVDIADELRAGTAPDAPAQAAWTERAAAALPNGRAVICRDPAPWNDAAGAYRWSCDPAAGPLLVKLGWQEGGATPAAPLLVLPVAPVQP